MAGCLCALVFFVGIAIGSGLIGEITPATRFFITFFSFFLAFFGFYHTVKNQKTLHIDISGAGQLRVSEVRAANASCQEQNWPHVIRNGETAKLLSDSTIWPNLLLLRLRTGEGKVIVVRVMSDSVSRDGFRALSVACRWLAAHNEPVKPQNMEI